jgi:Mannitol repressor
MADNDPKSASRKMKRTAVRNLMRTVPEGEVLFETLLNLTDKAWEDDPSKDRTAAIMGGTFIEHALRLAISCHLANDKDDPDHNYLFDADDAPYREFSSRARLARALGIISKQEFDEIEIIRLIRNTFAHSIADITFSAPAILAFFEDFDLVSAKAVLDGWIKLMSPKRTLLGSVVQIGDGRRITWVFVVFKHYWKLLTHSPKAFPEALDDALRQS